MMGHRGVRLGITYPEVTEMQVRAIFEAAAELKKAGKIAQTRTDGARHLRRQELDVTKVIFDRVQKEVAGADGRQAALPLRHDDRDSAGLPDWPTRWPRRPSSSRSAPTT